MRNKVGSTKKPPVSIITDKAVKSFKKTCNFGKDTDEEAKLKIERDYILGRVVSVSNKYTDGVCLIQYYDIFMKVHHTIVMEVFKSKKLAKTFNEEFGEFKKDFKQYNKFNRKHGFKEKFE